MTHAEEWDNWARDAESEPPDELPVPSTWAPYDLVPILNGSYVPPTPTLMPRSDGLHLLYPGLTHSIHGESESGKSLIAQAETARLISLGSRVLYLDFESDAASVVDRLRTFGVKDENALANLTYVRPESDLRRSDASRDWQALLARSFALVVIDGVTESLTLFGFATKENDDITTWHRLVPKRIADRTGAAVLLIDHVTKDAQTRGRFAIGGQAKMATLSGPAFTVEVQEPLGRGLRGVLTLRLAKDRPGYLRQRCGAFRHSDRTQVAAQIILDATSLPTRYEVNAPVSQEDHEGREFRPTALMQKVSKELESAKEPLSGNAIEGIVSGNTKHIRIAVACLIKEGFVEVRTGAKANGKYHASLKAYREVEDPQSEKFLPGPPADWVP